LTGRSFKLKGTCIPTRHPSSTARPWQALLAPEIIDIATLQLHCIWTTYSTDKQCRGLETMLSEGPCTLCCASCASESGPILIPESDDVGPFPVRNLLPAGTLSLPISQTELVNVCDHSHSADGWHMFLGEALLPHLTDREIETLCRHLDFLVKHQFLFVQCRIGESGTSLILRVYIIPFDLPNVQGRLRVRDEASVSKPARHCMRNVMPRIIQDKSLWNAHDLDPSSTSPRYFFNPDTVAIPSFCKSSFLETH
jgi:hypothetical protein